MNIEKKLGSLKEYIKSMASSDADSILEDAQKRAEEIKKSYVAKANDSYNEIVEEAKKHADSLVRREIYQTSAKCSKMLMDAMNEILRNAINDLKERINGITNDKAYVDFLKRATVEAIKALGEKKVVVKVRKEDKPSIKKILDTLKKEMKDVEIDLSKKNVDISGGVIVETEDGRVIIENTLENEFKEVRERFSSVLFSKLKS